MRLLPLLSCLAVLCCLACEDRTVRADEAAAPATARVMNAVADLRELAKDAEAATEGEAATVGEIAAEVAVEGEAAGECASCPGEDCEGCDACAPKADAVDETASTDEEQDVVRSTHKQTKLIAINTGDLPKAKLHSFCLLPDGTVLAACKADEGEVRLFSPDGEYQSSWQLPFDPDAINVGSDGYVYVAGAGKLLKLSAEGEVALEADSPHISMTDERREKIRKSIVEQQQKNVSRYEEMAKRYEDRYQELDGAVKLLEKNGVTLTDAQQRPVEQAKRMQDQWKQILKQIGAKELTDEQLDQRVQATVQSQAAVASISEADGEVFLATREETGYGYCVWRMTSQFTDGEVITKGLSGCCGQMDVQCCENGVYVAENSRHRVYHVSRTGEELGEWGHGAREGLEGFGSCCNPMNVAFGPERSVYTAESGTGRIKRYTPEGKLIELVGKVDVVPGCKKVSIAVGPNGDRVYMMDITRHHIVLMERLEDGDDSSYTERRAAPDDKTAGSASAPAAQAAG